MDARPVSESANRRASSFFCWRRLHKDELDHELIWLSTSVGTAIMGFLWLKSGHVLPSCTFHTVTGYPCPGCGATRATFKLLQGDVASALALNPLYVLGLAAVIVFDIYAAVVLTSGLPRLRLQFLPKGCGNVFRWGAIAVLLCNWAWLIYRGV